MIAGDLQTIPWTHGFNQVHTLVRQGMLYNKPIVGIGFGANVIGMYAATKLPFNWKYETVNSIKNV